MANTTLSSIISDDMPYLTSRAALLAAEGALADHEVLLSTTARKACTIVSSILHTERETLWSSTHDPSIHPEMPVDRSRPTMEQSQLYEIVKRMPKGALLHAHLEAMLPSSWLIDRALATPGMYLVALEPLDSEAARQRAMIKFRFDDSQDLKENNVSIFSPDYTSGTQASISCSEATFPATAAVHSLRSWLISRLSIPATNSISHCAMWARFQSCFPLLTSILYQPFILPAALTFLFQGLRAAGYTYVELRVAFAAFYATGMRPDELIEIFSSALEAFQMTPENSRFAARIIFCSRRTAPIEEIRDDLRTIVSLKREAQFAKFIAGYDLVGHETPVPGTTISHGLKDLTSPLITFRESCDEYGLDIPFLFHAGECLGCISDLPSPSSSSFSDTHRPLSTAAHPPTASSEALAALNIFDAYFLDSYRLGHATALSAHPVLESFIAKANTVVEVCPVSNEILGIVPVSAHPAPSMMARGVKIVLGCDDPGIFWGASEEQCDGDFLLVDESGEIFYDARETLGEAAANLNDLKTLVVGLLADPFFALQRWKGFGLLGLAETMANSIKGACWVDRFFTPEEFETWRDGGREPVGQGEIVRRFVQWKCEWEQFCGWVVETYGGDVGVE